jgi:HEAT repeat protein
VLPSDELREMRFRALCHSLLNDPSAKVRAESALSLGRLRDEKATTPLCQALNDKDEQVRINAVTALAMLTSVRVKPEAEDSGRLRSTASLVDGSRQSIHPKY